MKPATDNDGTRIHLIGNLRRDKSNRPYIVMEENWYPLADGSRIQATSEQVLVLEGIWQRGKIEVQRPPTVLRLTNTASTPRPSRPQYSDTPPSSVLSPEQELSNLVRGLVRKMRTSPTHCAECQTPIPPGSNTCVHCTS